jgi:hypothetical protein
MVVSIVRPDDLLRLELLQDLRRRRSLALKFILPAVLVLPFALLDMPDGLRANGLPLIVLFLGVLGSSVGLARLKESRLSERLATLPIARRRMALEYLGANVAMDGLQVLAPTLIMVVALGTGAILLASVALALMLSLVFANGLGMLISMVAGGSGEVHLYSAVAVLVVAGVAGLFFPEMPEGMGTLANVLPFNYLAQSLLGAEGLALQAIACSVVTALVVALAIYASPRFFRM